MTYSIEQLVNAGGTEWEAHGRHRVYFDNLPTLYGLELFRYGTGNISSARVDGDKISNTRARYIVSALGMMKFFYDLADNQFHGAVCGQPAGTEITAKLAAGVERIITGGQL